MYHICKSKSLTRPYRVVNVDVDNNEVLNSSQLFTSKAACITNIIAVMDTVHCKCEDTMFVIVQDDTLKVPVAFTLFDDRKRDYNISAKPKYVAGRNRKKKKVSH